MRPIQRIHEVATPKIQELGDSTCKVAYGFDYNVSTGALTIVRHDDGSLIKLADDSIINNEDYAQLVWSEKLLRFSWSTLYPGHLQVEIV